VAKNTNPYPKISIVTPSFNQGQFLEECIDSVLGQNYPNLEYIIMDGGSTDNSVEIIKKYEKYLAYWQSRPDGGQYHGVNEGLGKTTGKIMGWLNSDDKLHSCGLKNIAAVFSVRKDVEWIMGCPTWWNKNGSLKDVWHKREYWTRKKYLEGDYKWIQQESTYWRKSLWDKAGGYVSTEFSLAGDLELWARFFRFSPLYFIDALIGGFREYGGTQKTRLHLDEYIREAERIIDREKLLYDESPEELYEAPPAITVRDVADYVQSRGFNDGLTIIAPDNYTNRSWHEEAKRIFGNNAKIAVLPSPSAAGFEKIPVRDRLLFLGASHHLTGLFDSDGKIRFWNSIPSRKYFYQYEKTIGSYWETNVQKEKTVHKIAAEAYAVQDEYDAVEYEKVFGKKAVWLPDMISVERVRRGMNYPPLSQRPIDLLFIGKIQEEWYRNRQEILHRTDALAAANNLKAFTLDTTRKRLSDEEIESFYSRAKVVINPVGAGSFFNIRFFEALAAGCICLQQVENNGMPLKSFQERYRDYNAVYFTTQDLEQKIALIFSDLAQYEKNVPKSHSLLMAQDTGDARFADLGITHAENKSAAALTDNDHTDAVIAMATLGRNGRFANQIFQYAFLKIYAKQHELRVETPAWIGQYLFGHKDPPVSKVFPLIREGSDNVSAASLSDKKGEVENADIWGYFQFHTKYYAPYKEYFRSLFNPVPAIESRLKVGYNRLLSRGNTIVALHLRRGDYGYDYFFIAPSEWYKKWLAGFWDTLKEPVLFIASDEPEAVVDDFKEYNPVTAKDLTVELPEAPFYPDFYYLSRCDILAISNSSFSFAASLLNERCKSFVRPHLPGGKLIPFDPWNSEPIFRDAKVSDFCSTDNQKHHKI
jgi:glycosyltransferase involved in cell wall biosynthesis